MKVSRFGKYVFVSRIRIIVISFVLFNFVQIHIYAGLRIAIDIPIKLEKNFSEVRNYIVNGYQAQHLFGINHLIINALQAEHNRRIKEGKKDLIDKDFQVLKFKNLYLVTGYIDEPTKEERLEKINKAISDAIKKYKTDVHDSRFNFKVEPTARFISRRPLEVEIVQNVSVNKGYSALSRLMELIKEQFVTHGITFGKLGTGMHVNYVKVKSKDPSFMELITHNDKIAAHLRSVRPPKGTKDGFDTESKIHVYDGPKRLLSFDL